MNRSLRQFAPRGGRPAASALLILAAATAAGPGCVNPNRATEYDDVRAPQILRQPADDDRVVPEPTAVPPPPRSGAGSVDRPTPSAPAPPPSIARRPPPPSPPEGPTADTSATSRPASPDAVPVQAMVGQIAGQPIYAHRVLEGLEPQLQSLGQRLPRAQFQQQAGALIQQQVSGLVSSALIQDAAERDLTERQRLGLDYFIRFRREELLRKHGQGSLALAERNLLETTGRTLEQTLRDIRTQTMIVTYLDRNLKPLINVSRRDLERYYRDHYDTFNPPIKRSIQLIYAANEQDASYFLNELEAGTPFEELVEDERNVRGSTQPITVESNDTMFGPAVDPAVQDLDEGDWAGPLPNRGQQWFVHLAERDAPPRRTLFEAQVDIERALRAQQEFNLQRELEARLTRESSFTDIQQMSEAVLDIALARYARER